MPPDPEAPIQEDRSLEYGEAHMRHLVERAMSRIVPHLSTLEHQPAAYRAEDPLPLAAVRSALPESGTDIDPLLDLVFDVAVPASFNTAGPGYMAYIPGGGLFASAVADLIAAAVNRYVGVWAAAPLLVEMENDVLRWFAALLGYPATARGILTTGGSMANFSALVTARRERLPENFLRGTIYAADQIHHSLVKAAVLAGFPATSVVPLPCDGRFRLRIDHLAARVRADRLGGREPFLVVASAGTTNTGAVDDLEATADLCRDEGLWLHVDAAYGGFFALTAAGRHILRGIERADSVVLDPHKGLFLPYGTGALLVRDGPALRRAHAVHADYMPAMQPEEGEEVRVDPCEHGPELSRAFRGLRVWLPLKLHGAAVFRRYLEEKLRLARHAADQLRRIDGIEIVAEPQLSIVAFRLVRPGLGVAETNALNRRLLDLVLATRRVWLTPTMLDGRFVIRICVLHYRTHREHVETCLRLVREGVAELAAAGPNSPAEP